MPDRPHHESDIVAARTLHRVSAVVVVALLVVTSSVYVGWRGLFEDKRRGAEQTQPVPPPPRLQTEPAATYRDETRAQRRQLSGYGWVDRERGIVHAPIERAIDARVAEAQR